MNPHQAHPTSIVAMGQSLRLNRDLFRQLTRRDVAGRYQGSALGLAWSLVAPLTMLAIYTFVFSVVFRARLGTDPQESKVDFALVLFAGLIVHGFFAECVNRAPTLILNNTNLVKKVIFPLEILPWTSMGSALFHAAASVVVLIVAELIFHRSLPWTIAWLPVIIAPLIFTTAGVAMALSALGVYVRDIGQMTGMATNILLFMSPVFYPASALDEPYRRWLYLNPLTPVIEDFRNAAIYGVSPDWSRWLVAMIASIAIAQIGFWFFQRTRKGFADVL